MVVKLVQLPEHFEMWGFIPHILAPNLDIPLWQQISESYAHGGGWNDFDGFDVSQDDEGKYIIKYPGDPAHNERDRLSVGDETLVLFDYSWVLWTDGKQHKIARID